LYLIVSEKCLSQINLPTPGLSDIGRLDFVYPINIFFLLCFIVTKQENSPLPIIQARIPQSRIPYKYNSVTNDED
jgi:hypothetical protein